MPATVTECSVYYNTVVLRITRRLVILIILIILIRDPRARGFWQPFVQSGSLAVEARSWAPLRF